MLTFEEFFRKKKIDLQQLQQAEPALFAEFSKHYPLMGEKSFDHTKKYWFNRLRRTYPSAQEVKPHKVQAEAISQTAVQGITVAAAQNLNEAIERPKFKEDNLPDLVEENVPEKDVSMLDNEILILENKQETSGEPSTPKPAFKPRFNPKNIKKTEVEAAPEPETENSEPATEPVAKPAFKPRFNMQNIKKEPVKEASEPETENKQQPNIASPESKPEETPAKPAFTPRFKMQNIKAAQAENPSKISSTTPELPAAVESSTEKPSAEPLNENPVPATEQSAKPAYKPRFQMKNIKPAESKIEPVKEVSEPTTSAESLINEAEIKPEETPAKPAYKPHFQMKNVKPAEQTPEAVKTEEPAVNLTQEPTLENSQPTTEPAENKEAKPVYKPRFQMKNMPKPPEQA